MSGSNPDGGDQDGDEVTDESGGMDITLGKLIAYPIGALLVLSGLGWLILQPIVGLTILAGGIIALPITRSKLKASQGIALSRWATVAIVLVAVVAGAAMVDLDENAPSDGTNTNPAGDGGGSAPAESGGGDSDTTEADTTTEPATTTEDPNIHDVGITFTVGSGDRAVEYTVKEVTTASMLGSSVASEDADGVFVVVTMEITNQGSESFDVTTNHLKLIDEQEREFEADAGVSVYLDQDGRFQAEAIAFEQLQPGLTIERAVVFDVPPGEGYALKAEAVGFLSTADPHYVELGTAEQPD